MNVDDLLPSQWKRLIAFTLNLVQERRTKLYGGNRTNSLESMQMTLIRNCKKISTCRSCQVGPGDHRSALWSVCLAPRSFVSMCDKLPNALQEAYTDMKIKSLIHSSQKEDYWCEYAIYVEVLSRWLFFYLYHAEHLKIDLTPFQWTSETLRWIPHQLHKRHSRSSHVTGRTLTGTDKALHANS